MRRSREIRDVDSPGEAETGGCKDTLIAVTPGPQYRFRGFDTSGTRSQDDDPLRNAYAMQSGELDSGRLVSQTLENIRNTYQQMIYGNAALGPTLRFAEKARLIYVDL